MNILMKCSVVLLLSISTVLNAQTFFDDESISFPDIDEWGDSIVIQGSQKTYHGYKVHMGISGWDDLPGGAFVSKNVKPFYLNEERLNAIPYRGEIVKWRDAVQEKRFGMAKRIQEVMRSLKDCNLDIRIDRSTFYASRVDDVFTYLNGCLSRKTAQALYSGKIDDFGKVKFNFKSSLGMADRTLAGIEQIAEDYVEEYKKVTDYGSDKSSVGAYFINNYKDSMGIISNEKGSGTAFLMNNKWTVYLYTNAHVVKMLGSRFNVSLLDGSSYVLNGDNIIHVAMDRDVVRFPLKKTQFCLKKELSRFKVGDSVYVYGDSLGKGVVTVSAGSVIGVGPEMFEIDAPFVPGNSGSPVLNQKGCVIGIATAGANDGGRWETTGNRYSKNRYFVTSLNTVPWNKMRIKDFLLGK